MRSLEMYYTLKHESWLNMAEIEFSALARQCLDRRIVGEPYMGSAVTAWEQRRNTQ